MDVPAQQRLELIRHYFSCGYSYNEILLFLALHHNIILSKRHLKRILNNHGLYRRKNHSPFDEVLDYIENLVTTSAQLHGYRWVHLKCLQHGLNVDKETVRLILQVVDPEGVQHRTRRRLRRRRYQVPGPNYMWHLDSYDKLKPYGICLNGCIDGFSRLVVWVEAYHNNSDPRLVAGYFIANVRLREGTPTIVRADLGTENSYVKRMQPFLRRMGNDAFAGARSFLQGSSHHNQRIEGWWSFLRKHCIQYWMNVFSQLKEDGSFTGTFLDKSLIQFCFSNLIQEELYTLQEEWNSHRITPSRNQFGPFGRPNVMYNFPEAFNTQDYLKRVEPDEVEVCEDECIFKDERPCDPDIFELCCMEMADNNLEVPRNAFEATVLYRYLRNMMLVHI